MITAIHWLAQYYAVYLGMAIGELIIQAWRLWKARPVSFWRAVVYAAFSCAMYVVHRSN